MTNFAKIDHLYHIWICTFADIHMVVSVTQKSSRCQRIFQENWNSSIILFNILYFVLFMSKLALRNYYLWIMEYNNRYLKILENISPKVMHRTLIKVRFVYFLCLSNIYFVHVEKYFPRKLRSFLEIQLASFAHITVTNANHKENKNIIFLAILEN